MTTKNGNGNGKTTVVPQSLVTNKAVVREDVIEAANRIYAFVRGLDGTVMADGEHKIDAPEIFLGLRAVLQNWGAFCKSTCPDPKLWTALGKYADQLDKTEEISSGLNAHPADMSGAGPTTLESILALMNEDAASPEGDAPGETFAEFTG